MEAKNDPQRPDGRVSAVLAEIESWRAAAKARQEQELADVDGEVGRLKAQIEDLQRKIMSLGDLRQQVEARGVTLSREEASRAHDGLFAALADQAGALESRAAAYDEKEEERSNLIEAAFGTPDIEKSLAEWRQFRATAAQLASLPSSYRDLLVTHHRGQEERLRALYAASDPGPLPVQAPPSGVDVLFSVDRTPGEPALVSVILPVHDKVWSDWAVRSEDLRLGFAARVAQALYQVAQQVGADAARAVQGGHRGLLAIELELPDTADKDLPALVAAVLGDVLAAAPELAAAKVASTIRHVPVDYLMPPEEDAHAR